VLTGVSSFLAKHTLAFLPHFKLKTVYMGLQPNVADMHLLALPCLSFFLPVTTQELQNKVSLMLGSFTKIC
jgi:hypothetical protein